jgi:hypothetical protein
LSLGRTSLFLFKIKLVKKFDVKSNDYESNSRNSLTDRVGFEGVGAWVEVEVLG